MPRKKPPLIAGREEVLQTFTSIMRGEMTEASLRRSGGEEERILTPPKISERCKAAELLGKQYGLFDRREESRPDGEAVEAVKAALERMHEQLSDRSP